jgi:hypothetical protein
VRPPPFIAGTDTFPIRVIPDVGGALASPEQWLRSRRPYSLSRQYRFANAVRIEAPARRRTMLNLRGQTPHIRKIGAREDGPFTEEADRQCQVLGTLCSGRSLCSRQ